MFITWSSSSYLSHLRHLKSNSCNAHDKVADTIGCCCSTAICPLGRDRTYRRYWVFRSIPGLFVEDDERHVPDDCFQPCDQIDFKPAADNSNTADVDVNNKDVHGQVAVENAVVNSEKNTMTKDNTLAPALDNSDAADANNKDDNGQGAVENTGVGAEENQAAKDDTSSSAMNNGDSNGLAVAEVVSVKLGESETAKDDISAPATMTVHEQIAARNLVLWSLYIVADDIDRLVAALNPRGIRESALKQIISDQSSQISDFISRCDVGTFCDHKPAPSLPVESEKAVEQKIEKSLREALLDLEERIFTGNLGNLKVIIS